MVVRLHGVPVSGPRVALDRTRARPMYRGIGAPRRLEVAISKVAVWDRAYCRNSEAGRAWAAPARAFRLTPEPTGARRAVMVSRTATSRAAMGAGGVGRWTRTGVKK